MGQGGGGPARRPGGNEHYEPHFTLSLTLCVDPSETYGVLLGPSEPRDTRFIFENSE